MAEGRRPGDRRTVPVVRPLRPDDLGGLCRALPQKPFALHTERLGRQLQGACAYLGAFLDGAPVAHVLLHWPDALVPGISDEMAVRFRCAAVEDLLVAEAYRRRGVATALISTCETLARDHGLDRIGLAVGTDNEPAKTLYANRGYTDAGAGPFIRSAETRYEDGRRDYWVETEVFLIKPLD